MWWVTRESVGVSLSAMVVICDGAGSEWVVVSLVSVWLSCPVELSVLVSEEEGRGGERSSCSFTCHDATDAEKKAWGIAIFHRLRTRITLYYRKQMSKKRGYIEKNMSALSWASIQ